jgi:hypothetical protein
MDLKMLEWCLERTPTLNKDILEGVSVSQMHKVEPYIDWLFKCSAKGYPEGIKYHGGRRCTPKETFMEVTRAQQPCHTFDMARSDIYLMRYDFSYNGEMVKPTYLFLPFISKGGLLHLRDTQYSLAPVISGRIFNIEQGNIYLPSTRLRMGFWQVDHSCIINEIEYNQTVVGSHLYHIQDKSLRSKRHPLLVHYILARYGLQKTLEFFGLKFKIGYSELDELDKTQWYVYKSKQHNRRDKLFKEYDIPELRIAISKDTYYTLCCNVISSIFYIVDEMSAISTELDELDNPRMWLRNLYFFIFRENTSEGKIHERMSSHLESMDATIDSITISTFKSAGIDCETIYELFRHLILNFQDMCVHYEYGTLYDLQLNTVETLTFGIRKDIFAIMYALQKTPPSVLSAKKLEKILGLLKRDKILSVKGHGELEPVSVAATCTLYGPTVDILTHRKATAMSSSNDKVAFDDPGLLMHPSLLEIGTIQGCTGKDFRGGSMLNPFQKFARGTVTQMAVKNVQKLKLLEQQLKEKI